jgi:hypothetical protein
MDANERGRLSKPTVMHILKQRNSDLIAGMHFTVNVATLSSIMYTVPVLKLV